MVSISIYDTSPVSSVAVPSWYREKGGRLRIVVKEEGNGDWDYDCEYHSLKILVAF
jgi:hypothetical protein